MDGEKMISAICLMLFMLRYVHVVFTSKIVYKFLNKSSRTTTLVTVAQSRMKNFLTH